MINATDQALDALTFAEDAISCLSTVYTVLSNHYLPDRDKVEVKYLSNDPISGEGHSQTVGWVYDGNRVIDLIRVMGDYAHTAQKEISNAIKELS